MTHEAKLHGFTLCAGIHLSYNLIYILSDRTIVPDLFQSVSPCAALQLSLGPAGKPGRRLHNTTVIGILYHKVRCIVNVTIHFPPETYLKPAGLKES